MMKATEATTRTRRRSRHHCATSGPPIIATYYNFFFVSVICFGHQGVIGGTLSRFPVVAAESLRHHHDGQSDPLFRSRSSIVFDGIIRCDAEDYGDGIDIIRTESLIAPSSRTDDATPPTPLASYYHGRRRAATRSSPAGGEEGAEAEADSESSLYEWTSADRALLAGS